MTGEEMAEGGYPGRKCPGVSSLGPSRTSAANRVYLLLSWDTVVAMGSMLTSQACHHGIHHEGV